LIEKEKKREKEKAAKAQAQQKELAPQQTAQAVGDDGEVDDEEMMRRMFGFSGFSSTKGQDHTETAEESVRKNSHQQRKYRQYMNRRGGFNRNLDGMP